MAKLFCFSTFGICEMGCWGFNGLEVEVVQGRIQAWPVNMVCSRIESLSECPSDIVVILVLDVDYNFFGLHLCLKASSSVFLLLATSNKFRISCQQSAVILIAFTSSGICSSIPALSSYLSLG